MFRAPAHSLLRGPLVFYLVVAMSTFNGPVSADQLPVTTLTLTAPVSDKAGLAAPFIAILQNASSAPLAGQLVGLQHLGSAWTTVATGTTDSAGRVVIKAALPAGATTWRAAYAGDGTTQGPSVSPEVTVTGSRASPATWPCRVPPALSMRPPGRSRFCGPPRTGAPSGV